MRKGWLNGLPRVHDTARGTDAFVEVSWDDAITLVSAGAFHNAQGQSTGSGR
ncbi:hypothetical protein [Streptomyces sp. NPDC054787]